MCICVKISLSCSKSIDSIQENNKATRNIKNGIYLKIIWNILRYIDIDSMAFYQGAEHEHEKMILEQR